MEQKQQKYYDSEKKSSLNRKYTFRLVAVAYLLYLLFSMGKSILTGESSIPTTAQWLSMGGLAAATILIAFFSIKSYLKQLKDCEITKEEYERRINLYGSSNSSSSYSSPSSDVNSDSDSVDSSQSSDGEK